MGGLLATYNGERRVKELWKPRIIRVKVEFCRILSVFAY